MAFASILADLLPSIVALALLGGQAQQPLPDPSQLRERARASIRESEKNLEKYSCIVNEQIDELNSDNSVKKSRTRRSERFFVNGVEIDHLIAKDRSELTPDEARKEQQRVDKEVRKYSDPSQVQKAQVADEKQLDLFLRALRFTNGHRELRNARSLVVYDLAGDPAFHPHSIEEHFAASLSGRIWMDEESGQPVELRFQTDKDVKIAGGLFANLHKGFQLHMLQQRQPDGVWLTQTVDGSGDARAALFLHPRFRFRENLGACRLFSVTTQQKVESPK